MFFIIIYYFIIITLYIIIFSIMILPDIIWGNVPLKIWYFFTTLKDCHGYNFLYQLWQLGGTWKAQIFAPTEIAATWCAPRLIYEEANNGLQKVILLRWIMVHAKRCCLYLPRREKGVIVCTYTVKIKSVILQFFNSCTHCKPDRRYLSYVTQCAVCTG